MVNDIVIRRHLVLPVRPAGGSGRTIGGRPVVGAAAQAAVSVAVAESRSDRSKTVKVKHMRSRKLTLEHNGAARQRILFESPLSRLVVSMQEASL
jgi:hypothetical protein